MTARDDDFRVRPGRIRSRGARPRTFIAQVLKAAKKAGLGEGRASRATSAGRSTFGRGRLAIGRRRLFNPGRRVIVKARVMRHGGRSFRSAPLSAHIAYLKRDGVTRDGETARMFDAATDRADEAGFATRARDDRHHFRFIISPEDAAEMTDLRAFTRDLAQQMEHDLGTKLDWIAVDHWNTDNPHIHLLVRGVDEKGADLVISRDYISRGLRARAEELVAIELGPKPECEIRAALEKEIGAERWTRLDAEIRRMADETGFIDLRQTQPGPGDSDSRRLMIGRLQHLERMGLADNPAPGQRAVALGAEQALRDLGMRGDIIKTMHRVFTERGEARALGDYVIDGSDAVSGITGRLVDKGLHDELTGEAYAVIDATDGRAHHVRFPGVEALEHAPPVGGIVEVRRLGSAEEPRLVLAARSDLDLAAQVKAPGATWLDYRLVARASEPVAMGGFGAEVRAAMEARIDHLASEGLARRQGQRVIFARDLLASLRRRELESVGARLAEETGLAHASASPGAAIAGVYRQRLSLASGRFAMIDDGLGFTLVPWSPALERQLGRHVAGVARDDGGVDWSFGRRRSLAI
jgi:type IV secretory pathway VirD2 relaxase